MKKVRKIKEPRGKQHTSATAEKIAYITDLKRNIKLWKRIEIPQCERKLKLTQQEYFSAQHALSTAFETVQKWERELQSLTEERNP